MAFCAASRAFVLVFLVYGAYAWPYCQSDEECTYFNASSYCMSGYPHVKPFFCHSAAPNTTACGQPNEAGTLPSQVSNAWTKIEKCIQQGNGSSSAGFAFCDTECQEAFVTYITYGDFFVCFAQDVGQGSTFFQQTRSQIDYMAEEASCTGIGGDCEQHPSNSSSVLACQNGGQCEANTTGVTPLPTWPVYENWCNCTEGWEGLHCQTPYHCPNNCSGNGYCYPGPNTSSPDGDCHCYEGYTGDDCSHPVCPTRDGKVCDGHGTCDPTKAKPKCTCAAGWEGAGCSTPVAPAPPPCPTVDGKVCDGHGTCTNATGKCTCAAGWEGASCSTVVPPPPPMPCPGNCSSHGQCDPGTGKCECSTGFGGPSCLCPGSGASDCDGHGTCNTDTKSCECDEEQGWFSILGGTGAEVCQAYCEHPSPVTNRMALASPIVPIPGKQLSSQDYRCVCDATEDGTGWSGRSCNESDASVGAVQLYLGSASSLILDNCTKNGDYCVDRQLQEDLAYYVRTGSFPTHESVAATRQVGAAADADVSCSTVGSEQVCFEPERIQYMKEASIAPVNAAFNNKTTTAVSVRVAGIYLMDSSSGVQILDTATATARLDNTTAIVAACNASSLCKSTWNFESTVVHPKKDNSWPWWVILLIVLAAVVCCLCCVIVLYMQRNKEELDDGKYAFVHETQGSITAHDQAPFYVARTGELEAPPGGHPELHEHDEQDQIPDAVHDKVKGNVPGREHTGRV